MQAKYGTHRGQTKLRIYFAAQALITMLSIVGYGCTAPLGEGGAEWTEDASATEEESVDKSLPNLEALTGISNADSKKKNEVNSFRCYPCGKSSCVMTDLDAPVSINLKLNTSTTHTDGKKVDLRLITCRDVRRFVNLRGANPTQCGAINTKLMATSDPCGCAPKDALDEKCHMPPPVTGVCSNLCGSEQVIGDPGMIIQSGVFKNSSCGDIKSGNSKGFFAQQCDTLRDAVQTFCRCKTPSSPALKPCVLQRGECTPGSDVCCNSKACTKNAYGQFKCPTG